MPNPGLPMNLFLILYIIRCGF